MASTPVLFYCSTSPDLSTSFSLPARKPRVDDWRVALTLPLINNDQTSPRAYVLFLHADSLIRTPSNAVGRETLD